jgi:dihydrodipicolinate synthase/N-acetylneuraminate lyase
MNVNWKGVFPAITTQFRQDQSLDLASTAKHLDAMIGAGIHGVVLLGTVGENTALEYEEKLSVLEEMKRAVRGRIPVLTGVAEYTTALACRFARDAERIGVDGLMVLPAMVYKSDARETITHYRAVAKSVGLPIMAYNNPVSYAVDITPEMFQELSDVSNLVAVKESSENVRRITDLVNLVGDRYVLFGGVDDLVLESVLLGAQGWISGLVNAFPEENRALWDLAISGPANCIAGTRRYCIWTPRSNWFSTSSSRWPRRGSDRRWCGRRGCRSRVRSAKRFWESSVTRSRRGRHCRWPPQVNLLTQ